MKLPNGWELAPAESIFTCDDMGLATVYRDGNHAVALLGDGDRCVYTYDGWTTYYGTRYDSGKWGWDTYGAGDAFEDVAESLRKTQKTLDAMV